MNTDKVLALAREAGLAVTISSHDSLHKFAALIQRQMIEDGWRQCAEGQGTTQYCGIAEELRKDAKQEWVGLAGDEILDIVGRAGAGYPAVVPPYTRDLFKKIEDKLREKNG